MRGQALIAFATVVLAAAVPSAGSGAVTGSADMFVSIGERHASPPVAGGVIEFGVSMGSLGPDTGYADLEIDVPAGLHPASLGATCTGTDRIVCKGGDVAPGDTDWNLLLGLAAPRPGRYTITATLANRSLPDPQPDNDTASIDVTVGVAPATTSTPRFVPAHPRAGSTVRISVHVVDSVTRARVMPSRASCKAGVDKATTVVKGNLVTCRVVTRRKEAGKKLRGVIAVQTPSGRVRRSFAVRLRS